MLSSDTVFTPACYHPLTFTDGPFFLSLRSLHFCLKRGQIDLDRNEKISRVGGYSTNLCLCGVNTATTTPPSITPVPEAPPTGSSDESASLHIRKINPASRAFQATPLDHFGSPVSGFPNSLFLSVWLCVSTTPSQPNYVSKTWSLYLPVSPEFSQRPVLKKLTCPAS